jgi:ABC-type multidrug transport system ATPase subunit
MGQDTLALEAVGLSRGYGSRWALAGFNLKLKRGGSLLIGGSNGAGKTTLLRMLATTLRPTAGTLTIFGCDPWKDLLGIRRRLALLSHRTHLYDDLTAYETLSVAAELGGFDSSRRHLGGLLERVGLAGRGGDVVRTFSAGMRKRLGFARLLLQEAELVLIDEPYGQLDPRGFELVDSLIEELRDAGRTLVIATHLVERMAPRLHSGLVLSGGRMAWVGPAAGVPRALAEALAT